MIERIKEIIRSSSLSTRAFALKCGLKDNTFSNQLNGNRELSLNTIIAILHSNENISAEWLMRGKGEMIIGSEQTNAKAETTPISNRETALIDTIAMQQETIHSLKDKIKKLEAELIIIKNQSKIG